MSRSAAERDELAAQLALLAAPGLSAPKIVRLLSRHGSALETLRRLQRDDRDIAAALGSDEVRGRVRHALAAIRAGNVHVIAINDALYPERLRLRLDEYAPPLLFARGRLELLDVLGVGVVGSRRASEYGLDMAEQIGAGVARTGGCVVSGLALGIDGAAHTAALDARGATIAVLGCGIDVQYPRSNRRLQDRIARDGLILSELLPGAPPLKHHFTHRNRIIAALSEAVVVVEAGERSGAVSTGTHAATLGVPVFGVPNALNVPQVQGVLALMRDGAYTLTGVRDLLEIVGLVQVGEELHQQELELPPAVRAELLSIHAALTDEPTHADVIAARAGVSAAAASAALLELELEGLARSLPGSRYMRVRRGIR